MPTYYETILNSVTKEEGDYGMRVVNEKKHPNSDVTALVHEYEPSLSLEQIAKAGVGYRKAFTALAAKGEAFETDFVTAGFSIHGKKTGPEGVFVRGTDSLQIHFSPVKETAEAAKNAPVEKVPMHYTGPIIGGVFDLTLKLENSKITRGEYIRLDGSGIELVGPLAALEFLPENGTAVMADLTKVLVNKPSEVIVLVPAGVPLGICYIRLTTHYSKSNKLLNTPQTITFKLPLTVVEAAPST
jgi:hypothetical protein